MRKLSYQKESSQRRTAQAVGELCGKQKKIEEKAHAEMIAEGKQLKHNLKQKKLL